MPEPNPTQVKRMNQPTRQSEAESGIYLSDVPPGTMIEVQTENSVYTIVSRKPGETWISGHPVYCPEPVLVNIRGSIGSGGELREPPPPKLSADCSSFSLAGLPSITIVATFVRANGGCSWCDDKR